MASYHERPTWDPLVRWFHWINAIVLLVLVAIGTIILNAAALGVSNEGKVLLKTLHVWAGYAFAANLAVRLIWAFRGGANARWRSLIPSSAELGEAFTKQLPRLGTRRGHDYPSHSPLGKVSISLMLLCMLIMACTGLILAGTDLFYPPFGHWIASAIAAPGVDPATLAPYQNHLYDEQAYTAMRAWRAPLVKAHELTYFALLVLVPLHIAAVVLAEIKTGNGLLSAMITGKRFEKTRVDDTPE